MLIGLACSFLLTFHIDTSWYRNNCASFGANSTISALPELTSLDGEDLFATVDTSAGQTKKLTWDTATSAMKNILDSIYSPIFSTSATFFGLISDETGNAGGVVRATSPTLTTPTLNAPTLDVAGTDATGDIYYNGGSGLLTRIPIGSANEFLRVSGGLPDWDNTALLTNPQVSSSTFTATTSFSASNVNSNALILNGLAYSMPASRGASSTVLTEDGTGKLRWYLPQSSILYRSSGSSTVSQTATTTALTVVIPANTLTASGVLRISTYACTVSGGSNHRFEIVYGNGSASTTVMQMGGINIGSFRGNKIETEILNYSTGYQMSTSKILFQNGLDALSSPTLRMYGATSLIDTTQTSYIAFRSAESASGVETGFCGTYIELIKT